MFFAGCAFDAGVLRTYRGTQWRTLTGIHEVNEFCTKLLGPSRTGWYRGCFSRAEMMVACSDIDACAHEAVHASDPMWGAEHEGHRRLRESILADKHQKGLAQWWDKFRDQGQMMPEKSTLDKLVDRFISDVTQ